MASGTAPASLTNALFLPLHSRWNTNDARVVVDNNQVWLTGVYFSELTVIPEPNTLLLWLAGGVVVYVARRRANS